MRPSRVRSGVLFIGFGVSLLLFNLDRLDGYYFADLLQLWPILLVAIGLEILSRHSHTPALGYLSPLLIACTFVYAGYRGDDGGAGWILFHSDSKPRPMRTVERVFVADEQVDRARFYIDLYRGRLSISGGGDELGHGEFHVRGKVRTSISHDDGVAIVRVRQSGASRNQEAEFDMHLAENLPLTLDLKADDAEIELDGKALSVQTLFLEIATGIARITLGTHQDSVLTQLSAGGADVNFMLPSGSGLRFEGPHLPEISEFGEFVLSLRGDRLETAGFDTARVRFVFQLEEPVRNIKLAAY